MSEVKILEQWGEDEERDRTPSSPESEGPPPPQTPKWVTFLIEMTILVMALALGLLIRWGVYETAIVTSSSMESTLQINDRFLVDHRNSLHGNWRRGDIVLFETPETWAGSEESLVKRVIGLPGETVQVYDGRVYINQKPLSEDYLKEKPESESTQPVTLGRDEYFVLGDNRNHSDDSRMNGPVPDKNITGRAVYLLAPFGRIGKISLPTYNSG